MHGYAGIRVHTVHETCNVQGRWFGHKAKLTIQPENTLSIFFMICSAHWIDAAISLSVRGLPCGVPNRSSAVCMCRLARIAVRIPDSTGRGAPNQFD